MVDYPLGIILGPIGVGVLVAAVPIFIADILEDGELKVRLGLLTLLGAALFSIGYIIAL